MRENKWTKRDRKRSKRKHGQRESGRSVQLIQEILRKRAERARKERSNG